MNIFYIDSDPKIAARQLVDDHIRKMQIESAQMLCTTFHHYGLDAPYKRAHYNHPSTKWVRESMDHVSWLLEHGLEICKEFEIRYGKQHATRKVLLWVRDNLYLLVGKIPYNGFTPPPQCMDNIYKSNNTLESYRKFYIEEKIKNKQLGYDKKPNSKPEWIK